MPYQTKLSQAVAVVSPVVELLIVKFNVTTLSQPKVVCKVSLYIPVEVYVVPYQTKLSQADESMVISWDGLTVMVTLSWHVVVPLLIDK